MRKERLVGTLTGNGRVHRVVVWDGGDGDYWAAPTLCTSNGSSKYVGKIIRDYLERGYTWKKA
jgi:hypothetical protein